MVSYYACFLPCWFGIPSALGSAAVIEGFDFVGSRLLVSQEEKVNI